MANTNIARLNIAARITRAITNRLVGNNNQNTTRPSTLSSQSRQSNATTTTTPSNSIQIDGLPVQQATPITVDYSAQIAECNRNIQYYSGLIEVHTNEQQAYGKFKAEIIELKNANNIFSESLKDTEKHLHAGYISNGEYLDKGKLKECYDKIDNNDLIYIQNILNAIEQKNNDLEQKIKSAESNLANWQSELRKYQ